MILHEKLVSDEMSILHDIVANCICESEFCHLPSSPNVSLVQEAGPMGISRSTEKIESLREGRHHPWRSGLGFHKDLMGQRSPSQKQMRSSSFLQYMEKSCLARASPMSPSFPSFPSLP